MSAIELNLDSIVGPTHNYAGLSFGNVASQKFALNVSHPKQAALQGLAKMHFLYELGIKQAVLPPHPRPNLAILRRLGFDGSAAEIIKQAACYPRLLAAVYSASAMWAANAATVSPSSDGGDAKVHVTPANLLTQFHRSMEPPMTGRYLREIFSDNTYFVHHDSLPASPLYADEGAANHMRMCAEHGKKGIEIFVYGADPPRAGNSPRNYPARQTLQSTQALARLHKLDGDRTLFVQQNAAAIDAGVFHNDVIATANCDVLLCHAKAWENQAAVLNEIREKFSALAGRPPWIFQAAEDELSLADAVQTYIFNSQIVSLPDGSMALIAPVECREHAGVQKYLQRVLASGSPLRAVHYIDVRQSMQNGGGPACLRLRVVLQEEEFARVHPEVVWSDALYERLKAWVEKHYREELRSEDLVDVRLIDESRAASEELARILGMRIQGDV